VPAGSRAWQELAVEAQEAVNLAAVAEELVKTVAVAEELVKIAAVAAGAAGNLHEVQTRCVEFRSKAGAHAL